MNLHRTPAQGSMIQGPGGAGASQAARPMRMNPGDTYRGQVVTLKDGLATVRLADGNTLVAQVGEGVQLREGDLIALQVTENAGGRVYMQLSHLAGQELIQMEALVNSNVQMELSQPLNADAQGAQIAAMLKQYGVSAGRESIARVRAFLESYPQLDMQTAAFLVANGQQMGSQGAAPRLNALVEALVAARAGAGMEADHPLDILLNALNSADGTGFSQIAADAPEVLPALDAGIAGEAAPPPSSGEAPPASATAQTNIQGQPQIIITAQAQEQAQAAAPAQAAEIAEAQPAQPQEQGQAAPAQQPITVSEPPQTQVQVPAGGEALPSGMPGGVTGGGHAAEQTTEQPSLTQEAQTPQGASQGQGIGNASARELGQTLTRFLGQAAPQAARMLVAENAMPRAAQVLQVAAHLGPEEGAALINSFIAETNLPPQAQAPFLRVADAFRQALAQPMAGGADTVRMIMQNLSARLTTGLEPASAGAELNRTVTSLLTNLSALKQAFTNAAVPEAATIAMQAEARASALPSITQFAYMQIPVELYDRQNVADLYVMKRNRRPGVEKDEYTIAIALQTENLGLVEAVIRAREQDVEITFRMAEGEASGKVRESFDQLEEAIRGAGFNLRSAIMARLDKPLTPQTFARQAREDEYSRYSLDVLA